MSRLAEALRLYCSVNRIGIRQLSEQSGVDKATLSRFWNGKQVEARHYIKILAWLNACPTIPPTDSGEA